MACRCWRLQRDCDGEAVGASGEGLQGGVCQQSLLQQAPATERVGVRSAGERLTVAVVGNVDLEIAVTGSAWSVFNQLVNWTSSGWKKKPVGMSVCW